MMSHHTFVLIVFHLRIKTAASDVAAAGKVTPGIFLVFGVGDNRRRCLTLLQQIEVFSLLYLQKLSTIVCGRDWISVTEDVVSGNKVY